MFRGEVFRLSVTASNTKKLLLFVFVVVVCLAYFARAVFKLGIWGGVLFISVCLAVLLYQLRRTK